MIRVCQIISGDLWAGAEAVACHLFKGLTKFPDLELSAILLNEGRLASEIRALGIAVDVLDEKSLSFFSILEKIKKILKQKAPHVIHSHRYKENILAYLATKALKTISLIGTQHGMPEIVGKNANLKYRALSRFNFFILSRYFRNTVVVSKDIRERFINEYGFSEEKVVIIHNGVEIIERVPSRKETDVFIIGSSGRYVPVKDYPLMVEVAKEVSKQIDRIHFELVGDGPERAKIQKLIKQYGLESICSLRGFVKDISSFYQSLGLYLNTSIHEGIPISVLEAMAHGLPVIAPRVGGLKEIIEDGVQGYLVEGRSPKDFADKCLELYENEPLRRRMACAAREKVAKEFSIDRMAEQYYHLYCNAAHHD